MRLRSLVLTSAVSALLAAAETAAHQSPVQPPPNAQSAPSPSGAISGLVVNGSSGAPVPEAIVSLSAQPGTQFPPGYQARQVTDAKGRFAFVDLPSQGEFQLNAGKFGYLDGGYGRDSGPRDPLRSIVLTNGSWAGNLRVNLWSPAVISGTVRDEAGEPVVGVFVRAIGKIRIGAREELAAGPLAMTDDFGRYRIPGLAPGRYLIQVPSSQVSVPATTTTFDAAIEVDDSARLVIGRYPLPPPSANGRPRAYGMAFHPNAGTPAQASVIALGFGDDRSAIDVMLTPVPAVRVTGVVDGPPEALATLTLRLLPVGMENLGLGAEAATALVGAGGTFTFLNVPAGSYVLDAPLTFNEFTIYSGPSSTGAFLGSRGTSLPPPPGRGPSSRTTQELASVPGAGFSSSDYRSPGGGDVAPLTARMPLLVAADDVTGVTVRLKPLATLRGQVIVEADPSKPTPAGQQPPRITLFLDPAISQPSFGQPRGSATAQAPDFEIKGLQPAEYFLRAPFGGWLVKSIQWRGRDYTNTPIDAGAGEDLSGVAVTVTNALPIVSGAVRGRTGAAPESALVVVFPAQASLRTNGGLWIPGITSAAVQSNGAFRLTGVPAGDYFVAAIDRSRMATWRDPDVLLALERQATRVTLAWGQTAKLDLVVTEAR